LFGEGRSVTCSVAAAESPYLEVNEHASTGERCIRQATPVATMNQSGRLPAPTAASTGSRNPRNDNEITVMPLDPLHNQASKMRPKQC